MCCAGRARRLFIENAGRDARAPTHWERGHPWPLFQRAKLLSRTTHAGRDARAPTFQYFI